MATRCYRSYGKFALYGFDDWLAFTRDNDSVWYAVSMEISSHWNLEPDEYASYEVPSDAAMRRVILVHFAQGGARGYPITDPEAAADLDRLFIVPR